MSKDIRSYFGGCKKFSNAEAIHTDDRPNRKRNRTILDSDEDDDDIVTLRSLKKKHQDQGTKRKNDDKKPEVIVQVENFFGNTPVLQKKAAHVSPDVKKNSNIKTNSKNIKAIDSFEEAKLEFESDDQLEASILKTDDEFLATSTKRNEAGAEGRHEYLTPELGKRKNPRTKPDVEDALFEKSSKTVNNKNINRDTETCTTPDGCKGRKNAEAYQKYLHRAGPKNPGSKKIPKGAPGCFQDLVFVVTGILDSMEREEAVELIQKYGGRVTSQVSKKTSFLVVGEDPGESKIGKADKFGTRKISEDDLLNLILEKSKERCEKSKDSSGGTPAKKHQMSRCEHECKSKSEPTRAELLSNAEESGTVDTARSIFSAGETFSNEISICRDTLWVEKYKPKSTKNIVGQGGDKSNVKKLIYWLQNWHKNNSCKSHVKKSRPAPWAQNDDGSFFKAALLSGPPGVGKTTSAHLVCHELALDVIEFNASDTRSKRLLQEEVAELLSSKSLKGFLRDSENGFGRQVLVMDEVDGMAGNEDRGGIQELIQLIKHTKIPVIAICNDRNHPKMRSLANHCFDLRFQRPPIKQIKAAMMSICFKENVSVSGDALEELIISSNHDVRQVLHKLSLLTFADKSLSLHDAQKNGIDGKKPLNLGPWDVVRKVFSASEQDKLSLSEKMDLFFQDYSLGPLFVQDVYPHVKPQKAKNRASEILEFLSETADSIALGDHVDKVIRNRNSWTLLPVQAIFSSVIPGHQMAGFFAGKIEFPQWLGKNSKTKKMGRILQDLHSSLSTSITGDRSALNLDYVQVFKDRIVGPMVQKSLEGVLESVKFMVEYCLVREDLDHILELTTWPAIMDSFSRVDPKVKAAFTRTLNKECQKVAGFSRKRGKTAADDAEQDEGHEEDAVEGESDDTVDSDPMIKKGKLKKGKADKGESGSGETDAKPARREQNQRTKGKKKKTKNSSFAHNRLN